MFTAIAIIWFCVALPLRFHYYRKEINRLKSEVAALQAGNDKLCKAIIARQNRKVA